MNIHKYVKPATKTNPNPDSWRYVKEERDEKLVANLRLLGARVVTNYNVARDFATRRIYVGDHLVAAKVTPDTNLVHIKRVQELLLDEHTTTPRK